jgi:hypothetical protein
MNVQFIFIFMNIFLVFTNLYSLASAAKKYKQGNQEDRTKNLILIILNALILQIAFPTIICMYHFLPLMRKYTNSFLTILQLISTGLAIDFFSRYNLQIQRDIFLILFGFICMIFIMQIANPMEVVL